MALRLANAGSLYRVHGQPEEKRVTELQKIMNALKIGATFSERPSPREFRQLVERLAARPDGALLEGLVIRALAQAVYQQTNIGHFGLALEEYAHFTSPIRRYPDLLVHRAIKAAVVPDSPSGHRYSTAELQTLGAESSQRERRADDAARDVMGYLKCLYMQPRVGESFEATITSALEFGVFVQLKEVPIDGLVHISAIPGDYWELEPARHGTGRARTRAGAGRWAIPFTCGSAASISPSARSTSSCSTMRPCAAGTAPRHGGRASSAPRTGQLATPPCRTRSDAGGIADDVAEAKRNLVYGLHAVEAVIERAPERLLELWMAEPRQDARARCPARTRAGSGAARADGARRGARQAGGRGGAPGGGRRDPAAQALGRARSRGRIK